jgi:ABC-type polysaccharide/polyol phosphate export permease
LTELTETQVGFWEECRRIVADVWHAHDLTAQLTLRDIRVRYKQAAMGFGWALLMPMLVIGAGVIVRIAIAYAGNGRFEAAGLGSIMLKAVPWTFFVGAVSFGTISLTGNMNLVSKVFFPREVLPLSAMLAQGFDSAVGAVLVLLVLPLLGATWSTALLWVPVLLLTTVALTLAAVLLLSCANLFFRDVKYIVQVFLTFGIFFAPVFYGPEMLGPVGARLVMLNPISPLLEGLSLAVLKGHSLLEPLYASGAGGSILVWSPWYLLYSGCVAFGGLAVTMVAFRRLQYLFAELV